MGGGLSGETSGETNGEIHNGDLVDRVVGVTSSTKVEVETSRDSTMEVLLPGFDFFSRTARAARIGCDPQAGESIQIAASKGVRFSACAGLAPAVS